MFFHVSDSQLQMKTQRLKLVPLGPLLGKQNIQAKEVYYHTMGCRYILTTDRYEKKKNSHNHLKDNLVY